MLEKNEKNTYFDAHFHLADCIYDGIIKDECNNLGPSCYECAFFNHKGHFDSTTTKS